jgi:hypothetical protein
MAKYHNISDITFNGDYNHIGDKYESYEAYVSVNDVSSTEEDFLKPIFKYFEGEEKQLLLDAITKIRNGNASKLEPQETSLIGKCYNKLKDVGITKGVEGLYKFISEKATVVIPALNEMGIDISQIQ